MTILHKYTSKNMSGWEFVKADTDQRTFVTGNTASTAVSLASDIAIKVPTKRELKDIAIRLEIIGYADTGRK